MAQTSNQSYGWSVGKDPVWDPEQANIGIGLLERDDDAPAWSDYPICGHDDELDEDEKYFLEEDDDDTDDADSDVDSDYDDEFDDEDDPEGDEDLDSDDDNY